MRVKSVWSGTTKKTRSTVVRVSSVKRSRSKMPHLWTGAAHLGTLML